MIYFVKLHCLKVYFVFFEAIYIFVPSITKHKNNLDIKNRIQIPPSWTWQKTISKFLLYTVLCSKILKKYAFHMTQGANWIKWEFRPTHPVSDVPCILNMLKIISCWSPWLQIIAHFYLKVLRHSKLHPGSLKHPA